MPLIGPNVLVACILLLDDMDNGSRAQKANMATKTIEVDSSASAAARGHSLNQKPLEAPGVAVILNANARQVSEQLATRVAAAVSQQDLFYSRNLAQAQDAARQIVQRGYGTVICGGGDGTLMGCFNRLQHYVHESNAWRRERQRRYGEAFVPHQVPRLAFLNLGTGNGLRRVSGAASPVQDLSRIYRGEAPCSHNVPLIEARGQFFTFGGVGYDSQLLNDYHAMLGSLRNPLLRPLMQSVLGYFAAVFARTLPQALAQPAVEAHVVASGLSYHIDPRRGDMAIPLRTNAELFAGPISMVGAATTPFLGYGLRAFPFAGMRPDMFHLRIARLGPLRTLANLPKIWRGSYRNPADMLDFLLSSVQITLDRPHAFQHSGDDQGALTSLKMKLATQSLRLVDLYT